MLSRRVWLCAMLIVSMPLAAFARGPLDAIPDSAALVIRFKKPQETVKKVVKIGSELDASFEAPLALFSEQLGTLISNPEVAGVDPKGDWYVAAFAGATAGPSVVIGVPRKSPKEVQEIRDAVGPRFKFFEHENYVFYTQEASAAELIEQRIGGQGTPISELIDKNSQALFARCDLAVFVNVKHLAGTVYKKELDAVADEIDKALGEIQDSAPEVSGMDMESIFRMYGDAAKVLVQGVRDTRGVTVGVTVNPVGAHIESRVQLEPDSATDKLVRMHNPSPMRGLAQLPPGKLLYLGLRGNMSAIFEWSMKFSAGLTKDEATRNKMLEAVKGMSGLEFGDQWTVFSLGNKDEGWMQILTVSEAIPITRYRDIIRSTSALFAQLSIGPITQTTEVQADAEKYGSHSADLITHKMEVDQSLDPTGMQKKMMERLYGPDGMTQRIVYLRDRAVQTVGGGKKAMEEALASSEKASAPGTRGASLERTAIDATRNNLQKNANILLLADLPALASGWVKIIAEQMQEVGVTLPSAPETNEPAEKKRSYLGFSLAVEPSAVNTDTFIPIDQIKGLSTLFMQFKSLLSAGPVPFDLNNPNDPAAPDERATPGGSPPNTPSSNESKPREAGKKNGKVEKAP